MENVCMGELSKFTGGEASRISGSNSDDDQLIEDAEKLSIVVHKCTIPITGNRSLKMVAAPQSSQPKIQVVPYVLGSNEQLKKYYLPRMFSFGPIHHMDCNLKLTEPVKLKLADQFVSEHGVDEKVVYHSINNELENMKRCYIDLPWSKMDDPAWMFLVDGCAILQFINSYVQEAQDHDKKLNLKMDQKLFAQQDMFLLENQVPYQLLELISSSVGYKEMEESINKFINMIIDDIRGSQSENTTSASMDTEGTRGSLRPSTSATAHPTNLLELLRKKLVGIQTKVLAVAPKHKAVRPGDHSKQPSPEAENIPEDDWYSFRNIEELGASGIKLKSSVRKPLTQISFTHKWYGGTLEIPPLVVDDSTGSMFLNMIAYEMCPDFVNDFEVSSYISFLDSLIDHPQDVKELRKAEILHNFLGSDEEVANLFNNISTNLVPNPLHYRKVKWQIQKHYDNKLNTWIHEFVHTHFETPWSSLALAGVIIALVLSFVQTWYTIFPATSSDD